jgi:hypothetical protein
MQYYCHCGAFLNYSNTSDTWLCPNGHANYKCVDCFSHGKSIPLQWIAQYQRWYCYECKKYAPLIDASQKKASETSDVAISASPSSNQGSAFVSGQNPESAMMARFLAPNEQVLFYSEAAEIKEHHGVGGQAALAFGFGTRNKRDRSTGTHKLIVKTGEIAITNHRVYLVDKTLGFFTEPQAVRNFDAIYDPEYAKAGVELARAKNAEIAQKAKGVGYLSMGKFLQEQGYKRSVNVITGASLEKAKLGEEYLKLKIFKVFLGKRIGLGFVNSMMKVNTLGTYDAFNSEFELRIKKPMSILASAMVLGSALVDPFLCKMIYSYKSKTNITYEPLLEIVQAKASALSQIIKELEAISH